MPLSLPIAAVTGDAAVMLAALVLPTARPSHLPAPVVPYLLQLCRPVGRAQAHC